MEANKKDTVAWRLEDQEWWKKYSAIVNGLIDADSHPECPTVPAGMHVVYSTGSCRTLQKIKNDFEACAEMSSSGIGSGISSGSGSRSTGSSGSGSADGVICYGMHML